jgi:bifunctional DNA-binding transcriptional regulator/antitoxin component of YhaV-PrlF toxin-antitoxin module
MHADRAVVRNGRSQSITIPNHIAEAIGLEVGETVRISVRSDGSLTIQAMETVHTGGMTILKPKKTSFKRPIGVVPIIPEGRTIRKANRLHADMPQANHG